MLVSSIRIRPKVRRQCLSCVDKACITIPGSSPETGCEFVVHVQIEPSSISAHLMQVLEDELQKPTGMWTAQRPPLRLNGMFVSPHCGILYRLHDAEGLRYGKESVCL